MSTMACHFQNMTDAHRKMNPDWYDPSTRDPLETAMTSKCKNQNGNISKAKLDLALISIGLSHRLGGCDLIENAKYWKNKNNKESENYHKAISTTIKWKGVWTCFKKPCLTNTSLLGSQLPTGLNIHKLTKEMKHTLAKEMDSELGEHEVEHHIEKIVKSRKCTKTRLEELNKLLHDLTTKIAIKHLGKKTQNPTGGGKMRKLDLALRYWKKLAHQVKSQIDLMNRDATGINETMRLNKWLKKDQTTKHLIDWFSKVHKLVFPSDFKGWKTWLDTHEYHRNELANIIIPKRLSEAESLKNRKFFYQDVLKVCQSSRISSLLIDGEVIDDDLQIEAQQINYLRKTVRTEIPQEISHFRKKNKWNTMMRRIENIMAQADTKEWSENRTATEIDRDVELIDATEWFRIKLELQTPTKPSEWKTWLNNRDEKELELCGNHDDCRQTFNDQDKPKSILTKHIPKPTKKAMEALKDDEIMKPPTTKEIKELISLSNGKSAGTNLPPGLLKAVMSQYKTEEKMVTPKRTLKLLKHIITLALQSKDIPKSEKDSIITIIPKTVGQISSLDHVRPITVGPIIGRLINKLIARRIAKAIDLDPDTIDESQHAFLRAKSIHEPINTTIHCFNQSLNTPNGEKGREIHAIFYDISKAYDCMRWSSVEMALRRIGAGPGLIEFVLSSLEGCSVAMKTNIKGRITPYINTNKAVKQGCPLAPLLFALVMDELHAGYRREEWGYKLKNGPLVSSRGYCDDTMIVAEDITTLEKMNNWTKEFCDKHNFKMNIDRKSFITGRTAEGNEVETPVWWGEEKITRVDTKTPIRYLGCHISANLKWNRQIGIMNMAVMQVVARLRHKKITLLQGALIIKEVLLPKLEIGLRHAYIPLTTLKSWDTWLYSAMTGRAELGNAKIHKSSMALIIRTMTIEKQNGISKTMQVMENLTKRNEAIKHYSAIFEQANRMLFPRNKEIHKSTNMNTRYKHILEEQEATLNERDQIKTNDSLTLKHLKIMAKQGISIQKNTQHKTKKQKRYIWEDDQLEKDNKKECQFSGTNIPIRHTNMLWGKRFTPIDFEGNEDLDCIVMACTDGSTYRDKPHSGAGIAYIHDNATEHELFLHSYGWKIEDNDNFAAELAAIAKCIHSVPVTVALDIRTDSQASIDAINRYNDRPMNGAPLNFSARTYLSTIANAMTIREENGALTRFKHVKSHTGNRDKASIGNEAADRKAKQAALEEKTDTTDDITHFEHELSYVVFTEDHNTQPNTKNWTPIHGNIRQELKNHHKKTLIEQWANTKDRPKAAELINKAKNKILELIDEIWKEPTTLKIQFLLHVLNQADRTWPRPICERCMKNTPETPRHILECPANADIFNQASKKIGKF